MKICVFGASAPVEGNYINEVKALCRLLGEKGHSLIFGGYSNGLMNAAADGFYESGASITGVVPGFFEEGRSHHPGCTEIVQADELSDRKEKMIGLADAFIAVPGGIGTLDELFDVLARRQAGRLEKEIIVFNAFGFYDTLMEALNDMAAAGFITTDLRKLLHCCRTKNEVMEVLCPEKEEKTWGTTFYDGVEYRITEAPEQIDHKGFPYGVSYSAVVKNENGRRYRAYWRLTPAYIEESHCSADEWFGACAWEKADELEEIQEI